MFDRVAIKARAREILKLNLGHLIAAYVIAMLIPSFLTGSSNGTSTSFNNVFATQSHDGFSRYNALWPIMIGLIIVFAILAFIFSLIFMVYGVLGTGAFQRMALKAYDGVDVRVGDLLEIKDYWPKVLGLYLWMYLRIFLWGLLFIIPGIIAAYRYALAPYLLFEDPSKGINQVIDESAALMRGYKGELFMFDLSFIGWWLLCIVTFGVATLWVGPYYQVARAGAYRAIRYLSSERLAAAGAPVAAPIAGVDPNVVTQAIESDAVDEGYTEVEAELESADDSLGSIVVEDYDVEEEPDMSMKDTLEAAIVEPVKELEELAEEREARLESDVVPIAEVDVTEVPVEAVEGCEDVIVEE